MARKKSNRRNIIQDFADYFGNEGKLANCQMICNNLDVNRDLSSITKCKAVRDSICKRQFQISAKAKYHFANGSV
jgi:hypothetical protein